MRVVHHGNHTTNSHRITAEATSPVAGFVSLHRRTPLTCAAIGTFVLVVPKLRASILDSAFEWFFNAVKGAVPSLDGIYEQLLRIKRDAATLISERVLLEDVRRELVDPSREKGLQTKLDAWLKRYQAFVERKADPGQSSLDFSRQRESERVILERDWKLLRNDAVEALRNIERMGAQLKAIDPSALNGEEWRKYRALLSDEREIAKFLDTDMPTDPYLIGRMQEVAEQLRQIVEKIDKFAADLDRAIKEAEPPRRT